MIGRDKTKLVVVLADLHCGHKLGLLAPGTKLKDGAPSLGVAQIRLWNLYLRQMSEILARHQETILLVNGDLTHGCKYADALFTTNLHEQCLVAVKCLRPWLAYGVKTVRIVQGTDAHTLDGASEGLVTDLLGASFPKADVQLVGHGLFEIGGVRFDVAHHGPTKGSREWTSGSTARGYLMSLMMTEIGRGNPPPHWVVRSHYHSYLPPERVNVAGHSSEIVLTPGYCGMNGHGRQATRSQHVQTQGMLLFEAREGICRFEPMVETLDLRTVQAL